MDNLEQILVVSLNGSKYAIKTDHIGHILRVPEITDVPLTPEVLKGVCSIEGEIITVFDGKKLIDKTNNFIDTNDYKSRMLTIRGFENTFSIIVDEVLDNISPNMNKIEENQSNKDNSIEMLIKHQGEIIQLLSIKELTKNVRLPDYYRTVSKDVLVKENIKNNTDNNHNRYLFFTMEREYFALDIETIQEVIVQKEITPIADSKPEILGISTLRDKILLSIDLR